MLDPEGSCTKLESGHLRKGIETWAGKVLEDDEMIILLESGHLRKGIETLPLPLPLPGLG